MNTLSLELLGELDEALTASVDGGARALVITGQGRAFCAGAHLRYFTEGDARIGAGSFALRDRYLQPIATAFDRIETLPIPVIAAITVLRWAVAARCRWPAIPVYGRPRQDRRPGSPHRRGGRRRRSTKIHRLVGRGKALEWILRQPCPSCRSSGPWPRHRGPSRCGVAAGGDGIGRPFPLAWASRRRSIEGGGAAVRRY